MKRFFDSVRHAWRGVSRVYRDERNFRAQILAGLLGIAAGAFFRIGRGEWIALLFLILIVLLLELLNSAAEQFLDVLRPRLGSQVELMKDMMAGAVFLAALGAAVIGTLIFFPYLVGIIQRGMMI